MPTGIPAGPQKGEMANVLATRERSGKTTVEVTWPVHGQVNLSSHRFEYDSPRAALDAGWSLGQKYEEDAKYMDLMRRIYR